MFDGDEIRASTRMAIAEGVHGGTYVIHVVVVERDESFEGGGEDHRWERDFRFGRHERVHAPNSGFVKRYRETLLDLALPEQLEDLVRVGGKREGTRGSGTVIGHDLFVIAHLDGVVFLNTMDENLANAFHGVFHR